MLLVQNSHQYESFNTIKKRYTIDVLLKEKYSQADIAKRIRRDKSVVCRELQRNSDKRSGACKADLADRKSVEHHYLKPKKIYFTEVVKSYVNYILMIRFPSF